MDIYFGALAEHYYSRWPLTLVDVGARGGLQPNWHAARRNLRLIGFEPDPAEHAQLAARTEGTGTLYINAAVGSGRAQRSLNIGRAPGTSSLLHPNMDFLRRFPQWERFETVGQAQVATDSLDALLSRHGVNDPDFLKLDTQGAELEILEGGRETLDRHLFGVELEIQLAPLYCGQPSFGALDDLLRGSGFQLFDLRPTYWKRAAGAAYGGPKGQLVFADALYFLTEKGLAERIQALAAHREAQASKLLRALSVCQLYGYLDYAIDLFEPHRSLLEPQLATAVGSALRSATPFSARLPHFRGRGWLSHLFYRLHRALYPSVDRWASGGRHIGNID